MADLMGKTVLLTGATNGIGLEAAVTLARMGAKLVMIGRDPKRTESAAADVKRRSGSEQVSWLLCDFASQASIRRLADQFRAQHDRLDLLVDNAGGVHDRRTLTEDGIEATFAVNHLGYFLLTNLLLDLLKKSAPARIVMTASQAHRAATLDFDDLGFEKGYGILKAYNRSKLANVLFTRELAERLKGSGVTVNCLHPGVVATGIWSRAPWFVRPVLGVVAKLFFTSPKKASETITYLAASDEVANVTGGYFEHNREVKPSRLARDPQVAKRLWEVSERLTGLATAPATGNAASA